MAFWGVEIKPTRPVTHKPDASKGRLHISQATLGICKTPAKSMVQCIVGNKTPVFLCTLFPDKSESCQLNLEFDEADEVTFSVLGPQTVYLTGYFLSGGRYQMDESESYGEDIAESETERSVRGSEEDKYDDSFIDDCEPEVLTDSSNSSWEEKLDKRKTKDDKESSRRLKKKRQLIVSDDDSESQDFSNGDAGGLAMEIENKSEDNLPISPLLKKNEAEKSMGPEVKGGENESHETGNNQTIVDGNCVKISLIDALSAANGEPRRGDNENGTVTKKKKKEKPKEHIPVEATTLIDEVNKIDQKSSKANEEGHKAVDDKQVRDIYPSGWITSGLPSSNLPDSAFPSTGLDPDGGTTSKKKKRKEMAKYEKKPSADQGIPEISVKANRKRKGQTEEVISTLAGELNSSGMDVNQNQRDNNKVLEDATDQFASETQSEDKKKKKKKKRKKDKNVNTEPPMSSMGENNIFDTEDKNANDKICEQRTSDDLVIEDLESGKPSGKVATLGRKIYVNYVGKLMENGQVFDSNVGKSPLKFRLGDEGILKGWNTGIDGMHVAGKRKLTIPPSLGYGSEGMNETVPPNSWIVYEIELVKVC